MITLSETILFIIAAFAFISGIICIAFPLFLVMIGEESHLSGLFIVAAVLFYISIWADCQRDNVIKDHYYECIEDDYTVFSDGEKVAYPDKVDLDKYSIMIDDDNKEIILKE